MRRRVKVAPAHAEGKAFAPLCFGFIAFAVHVMLWKGAKPQTHGHNAHHRTQQGTVPFQRENGVI